MKPLLALSGKVSFNKLLFIAFAKVDTKHLLLFLQV